MNEESFVVRCIFGATVQEQAEAAGMKAYCDEHCNKKNAWAGVRGYECARELRKHNIRIYGQTW